MAVTMASPSSPAPGPSLDPPNSAAHPQSDRAATMSPTPKHHRTSSSDSILHDAKRVKPDDEPDTDQEKPSTIEQLLAEVTETKTMAVRFPTTIADPEAFVKTFKSLPGELRNRIYDFVIEGMLPSKEKYPSCTLHNSLNPPLGPGAMANICCNYKSQIRRKWRVRFLERFSRCCLRSISHSVRNEFLGRFWKLVGLIFCSCDTRRSDGLQVTWKQTTKLGYVFTHSYLHNIVYNVHYRGFKNSGLDQPKKFCQMMVKIAFKGNLIVTGFRFDADFTAQIIELFHTRWYEGIKIEDNRTSSVSAEFGLAVHTYQQKCNAYGQKRIRKLMKENKLINPRDADRVRPLKKIDFRAEAFNGKHYDSISHADLWNTEDEDQMAIDNPWDLWDDFEDGHIIGDGDTFDGDGSTFGDNVSTVDNDGPDGYDGPGGLNEDGDE